MDALVIEYRIGENEVLDVDSPDVRLVVGQRLLLRRAGRGPSARILCHVTGVIDQGDEAYLALAVSETTITIIPGGYTREKSTTLKVTVMADATPDADSSR